MRDLATVLAGVVGDRTSAMDAAVPTVAGRTLTERVTLVRDALLADLPDGYRAFAGVVRSALGDPAFDRWMIWPVTEAVAVRALDGTAEHFKDGLDLLAALTPRLTSEFAVRHFLRVDLPTVLEVAHDWTESADAKVRRLATEGTRPLLPWAKRVPALLTDPAATGPLLDRLYLDPDEGVRRSVANHINDVSRLDSGVAVSATRRWTSATPDEHTTRLVRHALRTLVKAGDRDALAQLGIGDGAAVTVDELALHTPSVPIGDALEFTATLTNTGERSERVVVDYVIHHRKADGSLRPKVFKLSNRTLGAGETVRIRRRHSFQVVTTRVYRTGDHLIELQVNGVRRDRREFRLEPPLGAG
ncbi:DNA alkylation repair protein [Pseudonocardia sp. NPDC046786]|uniref:DNA alkylation repair protein n=1 Tax=Pseudonocardia sp. NPDC046786 TaxID=3155471 RepID=UPI0033F7061F